MVDIVVLLLSYAVLHSVKSKRPCRGEGDRKLCLFYVEAGSCERSRGLRD